MTRTRWIWLVLILVYAAFFGWYTSFEGPLTDDEIDYYAARFENREPPLPPEKVAEMREFMEGDTGDDFVMVNVVDVYETPLQVEGVLPGETSEQVLAKYMAYMWPALLSRASHPVFFGDATHTAMDLMNAEGMEQWTQGLGMRYRSRRDMLEIAADPAFAGSHTFKVAALRKTIAFPVDQWGQLGDPRLVLALFLGLVGCALSWREAARRARQNESRLR